MATLLNVTCCVQFAHPVTCCCELVGVVASQSVWTALPKRTQQCRLFRVRTRLSSSNSVTFSMTFLSFPRPWVQLSLSKMFTIFVVWGYFLTLNSSTDTNSGVHQNACRLRSFITPLYLNAPINVKPVKGAGGEQGMGWGFDCLCWPWGRAFDWSCSPRGGYIWIILRPTWRYLTADSDEKDWVRTCVPRFHASSMRHTVWKDQEVMEANENRRRLSGFHCFVLKFRLF